MLYKSTQSSAENFKAKSDLIIQEQKYEIHPAKRTVESALLLEHNEYIAYKKCRRKV